MKTIVVAYDQNRGIGAKNDLLWARDLPADLRHFKELTINKSIIMGRKTFDSIGRPLLDRENIVISRSPFEHEGIIGVQSLSAAYEVATHEPVIIGGASIYEQAMGDAAIIYATEVHHEFPSAEVFFPKIGDEWVEIAREHHSADDNNKYDYDFVTYKNSTQLPSL